jgi:hypothetical protein
MQTFNRINILIINPSIILALVLIALLGAKLYSLVIEGPGHTSAPTIEEFWPWRKGGD